MNVNIKKTAGMLIPVLFANLAAAQTVTLFPQGVASCAGLSVSLPIQQVIPSYGVGGRIDQPLRIYSPALPVIPAPVPHGYGRIDQSPRVFNPALAVAAIPYRPPVRAVAAAPAEKEKTSGNAALEGLFDGRRTRQVPGPVRPERVFGLPERELEMEIGAY